MRPTDLRRIARSPRLLAHMVRSWVYELRHPGQPWWSPSAIELLERTLTTRMTGFEWGSGRSTSWLAHRLGRLTSVEHHRGWFEKVRAKLTAASVTNVELILHELPGDPDELAAVYWQETPYVTAADALPDESLDLVVVDGACRMPCAWRAMPKLRPGGLLLIDDALHLPSLADWRIPADWELVHPPGPGVWSTTIWRKPHQSDT